MSRHLRSWYLFKFLGTHSLLIGLFPFFLPVYLWTQGLSMAGLCWLLSVSGFSFCAALPVWQKLATRQALRAMIWISLLAEIALLVAAALCAWHLSVTANVDLPSEPAGFDQWWMSLPGVNTLVLITGLTNGVYNAFFWTTQRALFQQLLNDQTGQSKTGREYGNLQILVTIALKVGILTGGFILEHNGFIALLIASVLLCVGGGLILDRQPRSQAPLYVCGQITTLKKSLKFRDSCGSRSVFYIDGVFLYLESHFWVLSLFLVVRQDYSQLGLTVVLLAVGFSVLFYLIKDRIDTFPVNTVYRVTVFLYAGSWILRAALVSDPDGQLVLLTLLIITFCSSLFRLAFNKMFFDLAGRSQASEYMLMKSFASQCMLGVFFLLTGICIYVSDAGINSVFTGLYWLAAASTLTYLSYRYPADSI